MSKLFATLLAAVFAAATVTPVIAQDKKDAPKAEAKKDDKAKGDAKKADDKGKGDAKKENGKAKGDGKKADDKKADDKKADKKS